LNVGRDDLQYAERYQRNNRRLGKQRGAKVAQIDIARRLAHAIWHMLPATSSSLPEAPLFVWRRDALRDLRPRANHPFRLILHPEGHRDMSTAQTPRSTR
jgi:hypothetical protein